MSCNTQNGPTNTDSCSEIAKNRFTLEHTQTPLFIKGHWSKNSTVVQAVEDHQDQKKLLDFPLVMAEVQPLHCGMAQENELHEHKALMT